MAPAGPQPQIQQPAVTSAPPPRRLRRATCDCCRGGLLPQRPIRAWREQQPVTDAAPRPSVTRLRVRFRWTNGHEEVVTLAADQEQHRFVAGVLHRGPEVVNRLDRLTIHLLDHVPGLQTRCRCPPLGVHVFDDHAVRVFGRAHTSRQLRRQRFHRHAEPCLVIASRLRIRDCGLPGVRFVELHRERLFRAVAQKRHARVRAGLGVRHVIAASSYRGWPAR